MSYFLGMPARSHLWWSSLTGKDADEAKKLRQRLLSGPMVDIFVGKERKQWTLHQNLLCYHSPYFETELFGHEVPKKQKGQGNNKLELADDDPQGFELLVKWLYQGQLDDVSDLDNGAKYEYAVACHKLYLLASKFSMPHLSNLAMDAYRQNLNAAHLVPDADEINDIYRSSPPRSPFRRLMTKIAARQIMDPEIDKDAETYRPVFENNPDFAVEMVNAIRYMSGGILFDNPTDGQECEWHEHPDGNDCRSHMSGKGKSKMTVPSTNGVPGPNGMPLQSPTMARVRQTPLAELPTDKRTPRKLNLPPQRSAAKPGAQQTSTSRKQGRIPSTPLQNATGMSPSPTKQPGPAPARPKIGPRAASHTHAVASQPTTPPKKTVSANSSPVKPPQRPKAQPPECSPPKPPANSPAAVNGAASTPRKPAARGSNPPRAVSGPAQLNGHTADNDSIPTSGNKAKKPSPSRANGVVRRRKKSNGMPEAQASNGAIGNEGTDIDGFGVHRAGAPSETGTVAETAGSEDLDRRQPVMLKRKVPG